MTDYILYVFFWHLVFIRMFFSSPKMRKSGRRMWQPLWTCKLFLEYAACVCKNLPLLCACHTPKVNLTSIQYDSIYLVISGLTALIQSHNLSNQILHVKCPIHQFICEFNTLYHGYNYGTKIDGSKWKNPGIHVGDRDVFLFFWLPYLGLARACYHCFHLRIMIYSSFV